MMSERCPGNAAGTFLPAAASALLCSAPQSKHLEADSGSGMEDVFALVGSLLWDVLLPSSVLCQSDSSGDAERGGSVLPGARLPFRRRPSAPSAGAGVESGDGSSGEDHRFPEDAPPPPAGAFRHGADRISAGLGALSYFGGSGLAAGDGSGSSEGFPRRPGLMQGIVNRGRANMEARRSSVAERWVRTRRLLNRILGTNEVASGGLLLMCAGLAAAAAREAWIHALEWAKRRLLVRAHLDSRDDAYRWLMAWLAAQPALASSNAFTVSSSLAAFGASPLPAAESPPGGDAGPPLLYLPAPGGHGLRFRGRRMWIRRERERGGSGSAGHTAKLQERLEIVTLAPGGGRTAIRALLAEAHASFEAQQSERTAVYAADQDGYWTQVGARPKRPLSSVVLPQGQAERALADCREFERSESWYAAHGIPYRRGYLLAGPPGTGKTSLVTALAGALRRPVYVVSLSSPAMGDEALRGLLNSAAPRCVLLLEDVDAAFVGRIADAAKGLTFSGLLNAIDGVAAQEGRLLFMTTNHPERLSAALVRPGRVDVKLWFADATRAQARDFFASFYKDASWAEVLGPTHPAAAHEAPARAAPSAADADVARHVRQLAAAAIEAAASAASRGSEVEELPPDAALQETEPGRPRDGSGPAPEAAHARSPEAAALPVAQAATARGSDEEDDARSARDAVVAALADEFAARVPDGAVSIARLQGHLMTFRLQPAAAVAHAGDLADTPAADSSSVRAAAKAGKDGNGSPAALRGSEPSRQGSFGDRPSEI